MNSPNKDRLFVEAFLAGRVLLPDEWDGFFTEDEEKGWMEFCGGNCHSLNSFMLHIGSGRFSWEFYFYMLGCINRSIACSRFLEVLRTRED